MVPLILISISGLLTAYEAKLLVSEFICPVWGTDRHPAQFNLSSNAVAARIEISSAVIGKVGDTQPVFFRSIRSP